MPLGHDDEVVEAFDFQRLDPAATLSHRQQRYRASCS
jgi:hypothetical protein